MNSPFIPRMRRKETIAHYLLRIVKAVSPDPATREILEGIAAYVGNDLNRWKLETVPLGSPELSQGGPRAHNLGDDPAFRV